MALKYRVLDLKLRIHMLDELLEDVKKNTFNLSPRFVPGSEKKWIELLKESVKRHDDSWLALQMRIQGMLRTHETRMEQNGAVRMVSIPASASDSIAESEFNRFYVRAVCLDAISHQEEWVQICVGREVSSPRLASEVKVGKKINALKLLNELRANLEVDTALGIPVGPNSGLTVRRTIARAPARSAG